MEDNEFVVFFGFALSTELESGKELETDDGDHDTGKNDEDVLRELTLSRVAVIGFTDEEEVAKTDLLTSENIGADVETIERVGDILSGLLLSEVDDEVRHESSVDTAWCGSSIGDSDTSSAEWNHTNQLQEHEHA